MYEKNVKNLCDAYKTSGSKDWKSLLEGIAANMRDLCEATKVRANANWAKKHPAANAMNESALNSD